MRLFYGVNDPVYADMVQRYVWAVLPLSMVQYITQYLWARHHTGSVLWVIIPLVIYIVVIAYYHSTTAQMITSLAIGSWFSFIVLFAAVLVARNRDRKLGP